MAVQASPIATPINAPLSQILARTESVELGKSLVELTQAGEEKGNFQARLTGALDTIERYQVKKNSRIKTIDEPEQYLS